MTSTNGTALAAPERGSAVLLTLLIALLLAGIGGALLTLADTERAIVFNERVAAELLYAAEAAIDRARIELQSEPQWTPVLSGAIRSSLFTGAPRLVTPWNRTVDVAAMTSALQAESDRDVSRGANDPHWRLYFASPIDQVLGGEAGIAVFTVVWVADDEWENDGQAEVDENDAVVVRATAVGVTSITRSVQVTLHRRSGQAAVLGWREVTRES